MNDWKQHEWARYVLSGFDGGALTGISYRMGTHPPREDVAAFWARHRESILEWFIRRRPGHRPWAFFQFDADEPLRDGETQTDYLTRLGLLTATERQLLARANEERNDP